MNAEPAFLKGDRVLIRPASYPMQAWRGVVAFRTKTGFSVDYEAHGMDWRAVFSERELTRVGTAPAEPSGVNVRFARIGMPSL